MRCPGVAVDAGGVCAHYRDWRSRSGHQHLLYGLSWLAFASQPVANTVVISPRPDTSISVRIAASKGSKWSYSWSSCSPRRLWRCPLGLHRKHSHCTACGCIVSSRAAPIAPPQTGTEQLSSTAHLACAERMSESIDSPVASSTPACTWCMGWTRLVHSSSRMPFCSRRIRHIEPEADMAIFV